MAIGIGAIAIIGLIGVGIALRNRPGFYDDGVWGIQKAYADPFSWGTPINSTKGQEWCKQYPETPGC